MKAGNLFQKMHHLQRMAKKEVVSYHRLYTAEVVIHERHLLGNYHVILAIPIDTDRSTS